MYSHGYSTALHCTALHCTVYSCMSRQSVACVQIQKEGRLNDMDMVYIQWETNNVSQHGAGASDKEQLNAMFSEMVA